jgi:APA family basic amino acid/polyamine antiporter
MSEPQSGSDGPFERSLGLLHVTTSGVALIIGAGVFVLLAPATERAGGLVWASFVVAAVLCALSAFSYMELSSMFPKAGSEHEFARQVFPQSVSFVVGWAMALALIVATATVSLGFARYLGEFVEIDERIEALGILALAGAVALRGMGEASRVVMGLAVIEVGGLIAVIVIGVPRVGDHSLLDGNGMSGIMSGAALIFFAYIGFDEVISLSEETRHPRRTVPLALILALGISTLLYTGVAIAGVSVLGADELGRSARPMTEIFAVGFGGASSDVVTVVALFSTASTVLLAITASSRIMYGMASTGYLPGSLGRVHRQVVPRNALAVAIVLSGLLILIEDLDLLASATDALIYALFLVTNVVVIVLRKQRPDVERPFRIRGTIGWVPVVPILAMVVTIVLGFQLEGDAVLLAVGLLAAGFLARQLGGQWFTPVEGRT